MINTGNKLSHRYIVCKRELIVPVLRHLNKNSVISKLYVYEYGPGDGSRE